MGSEREEVWAGLASSVYSVFVIDQFSATNLMVEGDCLDACLLKVDVKKTYDSVEWCLLKQILPAFDFPIQCVNGRMACISSVTYTISFNGSLRY